MRLRKTKKRPQGGSWQNALNRWERGSKKGEHSLPRQENMLHRSSGESKNPAAVTIFEIIFFYNKTWPQICGWQHDDPGRLLQGSARVSHDFLPFYKIPCVEVRPFLTWGLTAASGERHHDLPSRSEGSNKTWQLLRPNDYFRTWEYFFFLNVLLKR